MLSKQLIKNFRNKIKKKIKIKTYTCSMHSEVKSDKPGKCPKCGMELLEKKGSTYSGYLDNRVIGGPATILRKTVNVK